MPIVPIEARQAPHVDAGAEARLPVGFRRRHIVADQRDARAHDAANPPRELGRRPEVDGDDDDAREDAAPERGDPFGPVLGPEEDRVAFAEARFVQTAGETAGGGGHLAVLIAARSEPVVVDEELAGLRGQVLEEVDERLAGHG